MPKMTLAWLAIYYGGLVASFVTPVYGLMVYLFEYYLRPIHNWWGSDLPRWRYSLIVSLVVAVSYFMQRQSLPILRESKNPALKWLVAFGVIMLLVTPLAVSVPESWDSTVMFLKLIVLYCLIIAILRSDWAFNAFVSVHIAGAGWWGWQAYQDPERTAGRLSNVGSSDTLNDNQAAGHLLTVLPFVLLFLFQAKDRRLRLLALVAGPLIVNTFILCNSRGATIGLVAALASTLILAKSGHRGRMTAAAAVVVIAFAALADPEFIARQQTTLNYQEESSAQGRMVNWQLGLAMVADHPLGVGGFGYNLLSASYMPQVTEGREGNQISPHNTWLLVLAEWGIAGLLVYVGFIGSTMRLLHRIRAECTDDATFYRSLAIQIGLIGTLVAATFSDRLYGESIIWLCALAFVAYHLHRHEVQGRELDAGLVAAEAPPSYSVAPGKPVGRTA